MGFLGFGQKKQNSRQAFCPYCGKQIITGGKFCSSCGKPVMQQGMSNTVTELTNTVDFIKCPNCGSSLSAFDAVCLHCGNQVARRVASFTVQQFSAQIDQIEEDRRNARGKRFGLFTPFPRNVTDTAAREIALIKSFPIPNTVEEIVEFMLLAEASIDTRLSKKTVINKLNKSPNWNVPNDNQWISDAWVAKMLQLYRKAEISFGNDPMFGRVQRIYQQKMKELSIKF